MKNSNNNPSTIKAQAQNVATTTVKVLTYPVHLVLQTTADLVSLAQGQAINVIDGTPVIKATMECQAWTQDQQAYVVGKIMTVKEKYDRQREANRQQDIERLNKALNKLEGVEQMETPVVPAPPITEPIVAAPLVETLGSSAKESSYPINKNKKVKTPVMTEALV